MPCHDVQRCLRSPVSGETVLVLAEGGDGAGVAGDKDDGADWYSRLEQLLRYQNGPDGVCVQMVGEVVVRAAGTLGERHRMYWRCWLYSLHVSRALSTVSATLSRHRRNLSHSGT